MKYPLFSKYDEKRKTLHYDKCSSASNVFQCNQARMYNNTFNSTYYVVFNNIIHKYDFLLSNGEKTYLKCNLLGLSLGMRISLI